MTFAQLLKRELQSRKYRALLAGVVGIAVAKYAGIANVFEWAMMIIAYILGVSLEDFGSKRAGLPAAPAETPTATPTPVAPPPPEPAILRTPPADTIPLTFGDLKE